MCVFLISPVQITELLTSELIDTPVFYNLAPRPIKYRVSVPIPSYVLMVCFDGVEWICYVLMVCFDGVEWMRCVLMLLSGCAVF